MRSKGLGSLPEAVDGGDPDAGHDAVDHVHHERGDRVVRDLRRSWFEADVR